MAKITASARGTKRNRATPLRKNIGRKTIQIQSVETSAGTEIWAAPSKMASSSSCPSSRKRSMFSMVTVASSTRMPTARASPPSVMMLMVSPEQAKDDDGGQNRERNRDGDDERAAPAAEKEQDHQPGQAGGNDGFANDSADGGAHKNGLISQRLNFAGREAGWQARAAAVP